MRKLECGLLDCKYHYVIIKNMSATITLPCSNKDCDFNVHLSVSFPVWKDDTPTNLKFVPPGPVAKEYIIGYWSQMVCLGCLKIVKIEKDLQYKNITSCPQCHSDNFFNVNTGVCPYCRQDTIVRDWSTDVAF